MARSDMTKNGNIVTWSMHVGGDDVDIPGGVHIQVRCDISDVTLDECYMHTFGTSARVDLQAQCRKLSNEKLLDLSTDGLAITYNQVRTKWLLGGERKVTGNSTFDFGASIVGTYNEDGLEDAIDAVNKATRLGRAAAVRYIGKLLDKDLSEFVEEPDTDE